MQVVSEFEHQGEVIKARCMPQDQTLVASMTNEGNVNLYNMPEVSNLTAPASAEVQRLKTTLTGL